MSSGKWHGIYAATVLPFDADFGVDVQALRQHLDTLANVKGMSGVVVNGHTGEVHALTPEERADVASVAVQHLKGRLKVVTSIAAESLAEARKQATQAREAGVDGILVMPPHYWLRFGKSDSEAVSLFETVAQASGLPLIIHQYPAWTKASYSADTLLALANIPEVAAVKIGTRDFAKYERQVRELREHAPHIAILTCHDEYLLSSMVVGVDGAIVGFAAFVPELIVGLFEAVDRGDWQKAREIDAQLYPLKMAVYGMGEPTAFAHARMKVAMELTGRLRNARARPPTPDVSSDERMRIRDLMKQGGLDVTQ